MNENPHLATARITELGFVLGSFLAAVERVGLKRMGLSWRNRFKRLFNRFGLHALEKVPDFGRISAVATAFDSDLPDSSPSCLARLGPFDSGSLSS